jgi:ABC-2 type transport system permease protein
MNRALWKKAVADAWRQGLVSCLLLFGFSLLFVWLMKQIPAGAFGTMLRWLPDFFRDIVQVPIAALATPLGQLSVLYVHVVTILVCVGWALGRGSDSIAGEIGRGTMDLVLSLPIRRPAVIVAPAVVAALGGSLIVASLWLGAAVGLRLMHFDGGVSPLGLLPGAINLWCMVFCLTGITTLVSSLGRDRWRTIAVAAGVYVLSLIVEMVRRIWKAGDVLKYATFLSAFRPQELILVARPDESIALRCNGALLAVGLLCYLAAAIILARRDIPTAR